MSFWRLYYHLVWDTKHHLPTLDAKLAVVAERSIRHTANELGLIFHAIGFMTEHVHLVVGIPPRHSIAHVMQKVKGSSSHLLAGVAAESPESVWTGWQGEYGVMSFGERSLEQIVRYVEHQQDHQLTGDLLPAFEIVGTDPPGSPGLQPGIPGIRRWSNANAHCVYATGSPYSESTTIRKTG